MRTLSSRGDSPDGGRAAAVLPWRLALWLGLTAGWLVMLPYLWSAFATLPTAERLEQTRTVAIPTLQTVALLAARSALELGAVLALLWPWWQRHYAKRLLAAATGLVAWFVLTTPLSLSAVGWVHRRWLAAMTLALLLAFGVVLAARAGRAARRLLRTRAS
jgi:hypothetical protein